VYLEFVAHFCATCGYRPFRQFHGALCAAHYAPQARVEVVEDASDARRRVEALRALGERADLLDPGPDPDHYARHLYSWLRAADERGVTTLVAVPPPAVGLGWAVRDRLRKAAAPR